MLPFATMQIKPERNYTQWSKPDTKTIITCYHLFPEPFKVNRHRYKIRSKKKRGHVGQGLEEQIRRWSKPRDAVPGRHCSTVLGTPAKRFFFLSCSWHKNKILNWVTMWYDGINLLHYSNHFTIYVSHNIILDTLNIYHIRVFFLNFMNSSC